MWLFLCDPVKQEISGIGRGCGEQRASHRLKIANLIADHFFGNIKFFREAGDAQAFLRTAMNHSAIDRNFVGSQLPPALQTVHYSRTSFAR